MEDTDGMKAFRKAMLEKVDPTECIYGAYEKGGKLCPLTTLAVNEAVNTLCSGIDWSVKHHRHRIPYIDTNNVFDALNYLKRQHSLIWEGPDSKLFTELIQKIRQSAHHTFSRFQSEDVSGFIVVTVNTLVRIENKPTTFRVELRLDQLMNWLSWEIVAEPEVV